ncbi:hypothetical protein [Streptomyces sp. NPDC059649]|uniref:hypothetical protein n=1 Tax=Streptomyces sp. NPDC059649 TaxID=3346895 RepID=UPI0036C41A40
MRAPHFSGGSWREAENSEFLRAAALVSEVESGERSSEVNAHATSASRARQAPPEKGQLKVKYAKSAAVVAGSVMALGAVVPAFAAQPGAPKMSLNGGMTDAVNSLHNKLDGHQVRPVIKKVKTAGEKVRAANANQLIRGVTGAAKSIPMLGGLPLKS